MIDPQDAGYNVFPFYGVLRRKSRFFKRRRQQLLGVEHLVATAKSLDARKLPIQRPDADGPGFV
jgi:hypothetical protein